MAYGMILPTLNRLFPNDFWPRGAKRTSFRCPAGPEYCCLVVDLPLWKKKSVGMMTFPTEWENTKAMFQSPKHQAVQPWTKPVFGWTMVNHGEPWWTMVNHGEPMWTCCHWPCSDRLLLICLVRLVDRKPPQQSWVNSRSQQCLHTTRWLPGQRDSASLICTHLGHRTGCSHRAPPNGVSSELSLVFVTC